MTIEKQITAEEALLWLAGLEKKCDWLGSGDGLCPNCGGSGKVPVLDLREPCPRMERTYATTHISAGLAWCHLCGGRNWVPKQGVEALYQAMHDAGWTIKMIWYSPDPFPSVGFYKEDPKLPGAYNWRGQDATTHIAAYKAMKQAGY